MKHARKDYNRIQDPAGKIGKDEPVFLLRGQDKFAAIVIHLWANLVGMTGNQELADNVHRFADDMLAWQKNNGCKIPDAPKEAFASEKNIQEKEDRKMMIEFLVDGAWIEFTKLTRMQYPPEGRISSFKKFTLVAIEVDKEAFGPRITAYRITESLEKE